MQNVQQVNGNKKMKIKKKIKISIANINTTETGLIELLTKFKLIGRDFNNIGPEMAIRLNNINLNLDNAKKYDEADSIEDLNKIQEQEAITNNDKN